MALRNFRCALGIPFVSHWDTAPGVTSHNAAVRALPPSLAITSSASVFINFSPDIWCLKMESMHQYRTLNITRSSTLNHLLFRMLNMNLLTDRLAYIYRQKPDLEGECGQIGLVKASGASKSVVNQWLAGKIKSMDIKYALNIERQLGYSHIWLMTGEGDPLDVPVYGVKAPRTIRPVEQPPPPNLQWVTPKESELLSSFRSLKPVQQEAVSDLAKSFTQAAAGRTVTHKA